MATNKKRWMRAVTLALVICLTLSVCRLHGTCEGVRENVVRLHVLANSDSTEDQALKLKVRDAVLAASADWQDAAATPAEALALAQERLPALQAVAQEAVAAEGYDYAVRAEVCRMYFTTRQYDTVTLPAGMYEAVRVVIGDGKGQNWWCVLYPPLCLGAATDRDLAQVMGTGQAALMTGGQQYILRFKVVEWFEMLLQPFRK